MALSSITVFLYPSFRPDIERLKYHQHCHFLTFSYNNNNNNNNNDDDNDGDDDDDDDERGHASKENSRNLFCSMYSNF